MSEELCAKCGEKLEAGARTCWACGTLTAQGRKARRAPEDEDETWRKSVEAAKARQSQKPAVDPDEALRRVIAESGTQEQIQRVVRVGIAHDDTRSDYTRFRASARSVATVGILLAALFAMAALLLVAFALVVLPENGGALLSVVGVVVFGGAAITVHFIFRTLAGTIETVADAADNARRAVLLLRDISATPKPQDGE